MSVSGWLLASSNGIWSRAKLSGCWARHQHIIAVQIGLQLINTMPIDNGSAFSKSDILQNSRNLAGLVELFSDWYMLWKCRLRSVVLLQQSKAHFNQFWSWHQKPWEIRMHYLTSWNFSVFILSSCLACHSCVAHGSMSMNSVIRSRHAQLARWQEHAVVSF